MGWASGSDVFTKVIEAVKETGLGSIGRKNLYKKLIHAFVYEADWDTEDECKGLDPAYDKALKELHKKWGIEDDEEELGGEG